MKVNKSSIFCTLIIVVVSILSYNLYYKERHIIPPVIEYKQSNIQGKNGITFNQLYTLKKHFDIHKISGYSEENMSLSTHSQSLDIVSILADENYIKTNNIKIIYGSSIDKYAISNESKVVVISDELARKIFFTTDVIGNTIKLDDSVFKIVGVYQEDESFTYEISKDVYERVIIPYTNSMNYGEQQVEAVSVLSNEDENTISKKLDLLTNSKINNYDVINYSQEKELGYQYVRMVYLVIFFTIFIFILVDIIKKAQFERKYLLIIICKLIVCLLCFLVIYYLLNFNLVIKAEYIPKDNIFDFNYYKKIFIQNCNNINNINRFNSVSERYVKRANSILFGYSNIILLSFIVIILNYKDSMLRNIKKDM